MRESTGVEGQGAPATGKRILKSRWSRVVAAGTAVCLLGIAIFVLVDDPNRDTDADGLPDRIEEAGWTTAEGAVFVTDPLLADTDGDGLLDGEEAGEVVSAQGEPVVYAGSSDPLDTDTDGDGLDDGVETRGWSTVRGAAYQTDPSQPDSDGDGLADGEEAGLPVPSLDGETRYLGVSDPRKVDSDEDGLPDATETRGWTSTRGAVYLTDPMSPDSDGDGLTDLQEAGALTYDSVDGVQFLVFSNPLVVDSDDDGLTDLDEADLSLDPFASDTDGDGLTDGAEVNEVGSAPDLADTDGDGFNDGFEVANREAKGLDPLWPDVKVAPATYAKDFAAGAFQGSFSDPSEGETLAWLAGYLFIDLMSSVPAVGPLIGTAAAVRDAVALAIDDDWVSSTTIFLSLIPVSGNPAFLPITIAQFIGGHPELAPAVGALIESISWVSADVKIAVLKVLSDDQWDVIRGAGFSEAALMRLQQGKVSFADLAASLSSANIVSGANARFLASDRAGERFLASIYSANGAPVGTRVALSTAACVAGCNEAVRRIDVIADGVAHESKVGRVYLTPAIAAQIASDAYLTETGVIEGAHWHFFASASSNTIGPTADVIGLLEEYGIPFTIHPPA